MTKMPSYEVNCFWEPQDEAEAVELAINYTDNGLDPLDFSGSFGNYSHLASADLPWDTKPFEPVDLSGAKGAGSVDLALGKGDIVEWPENGVAEYGRIDEKDEAGPTDLTDDDLYTLWKSSTSSAEEFANLRQDLESHGCSIEFSSEEPTVEVSDEELWRHYEDVKSGEAGRRRARRGVEDKFEERLAYWREATKRGEPLPRDLEGLI